MDYEKKYKEALERARCLYSQHSIEWCDKDIVTIFPELKESENKKIRKALISILESDFEKDTTIYDISVGDIITWLKKPIIDKEHIKSIVDYLLDYKLFIESEEYGNVAKSVQEEIDWLNNLK